MSYQFFFEVLCFLWRSQLTDLLFEKAFWYSNYWVLKKLKKALRIFESSLFLKRWGIFLYLKPHQFTIMKTLVTFIPITNSFLWIILKKILNYSWLLFNIKFMFAYLIILVIMQFLLLFVYIFFFSYIHRDR